MHPAHYLNRLEDPMDLLHLLEGFGSQVEGLNVGWLGLIVNATQGSTHDVSQSYPNRNRLQLGRR